MRFAALFVFHFEIFFSLNGLGNPEVFLGVVVKY